MYIWFICANYVIRRYRPTFSDVIKYNVSSVTKNAAFQCRTVHVIAVHILLDGVIVEYSQITGNYGHSKDSSPSHILLYRARRNIFMQNDMKKILHFNS